MSAAKQIMKLADGARNANDIAALLRTHPTYVRFIARKNGIQLPRPPSDKMVDVAGQSFGSLTAVSRVPGANGKWFCRCACGTERIVPTSALRAGDVKSCGCRYRPRLTLRIHNQSRTKLYAVWRGMTQRCHNPNNKAFRHYGARGISVCPEWRKSFEKFRDYMGERPSPKHSIDRIDNDGNYEPGNVRWATQKQQVQNRRPRHTWISNDSHART